MVMIVGFVAIALWCRAAVCSSRKGREKLRNPMLAKKEPAPLAHGSGNKESRGRWAAHLIKDVRHWFSRKHGEVDYYLTQLLSKNGPHNSRHTAECRGRVEQCGTFYLRWKEGNE